MKYYIIAGEASGDLHASKLMRGIKARDPLAEFRCWGGALMEATGGAIVKHYRELAFMGFQEVLFNIRTIFHNIRFCKEDITEWNPDAVILVDYPGFNMRIAKFAKAKGYKVFYYISPQVWAWKKRRIHKVHHDTDLAFVILPFEKEFYQGHDYNVDFVGHPMFDAIHHQNDTNYNFGLSDDRPIIAVLPGSRKQEISKGLPIMIKVLQQFPQYRFIIAGLTSISPDLYKKYAEGVDIEIIYNKSTELLRIAKVALVTSGTATLEAALIGIPEVVCYKGNALSFFIAKNIVNIKYISLVNLIMDKFIVTELIQNELSPKNLKLEFEKLLFDEQYVQTMLNGFEELKTKLGGRGASEKAASLMYRYLRDT